MNVFPLHDELIDVVVRFANEKITSEEAASEIFGPSWQPDKWPTVPTIKKIQKELRGWLGFGRQAFRDAGFAAMGFDPAGDGPIDSGIQLSGMLGISQEITEMKEGIDDPQKLYEYRVTWNWKVSNASLRAICGLGVASIYQAGLYGRALLCARDGCGNYFVDRESRGTPRGYCRERSCDLIRNREAVARSNAKKKKRRKK